MGTAGDVLLFLTGIVFMGVFYQLSWLTGHKAEDFPEGQQRSFVRMRRILRLSMPLGLGTCVLLVGVLIGRAVVPMGEAWTRIVLAIGVALALLAGGFVLAVMRSGMPGRP